VPASQAGIPAPDPGGAVPAAEPNLLHHLESVCDAVLLVNAPSGRGPPSPRRPTAFFGQFVALGRGAVKHGAEDCFKFPDLLFKGIGLLYTCSRGTSDALALCGVAKLRERAQPVIFGLSDEAVYLWRDDVDICRQRPRDDR